MNTVKKAVNQSPFLRAKTVSAKAQKTPPSDHLPPAHAFSGLSGHLGVFRTPWLY